MGAEADQGDARAPPESRCRRSRPQRSSSSMSPSSGVRPVGNGDAQHRTGGDRASASLPAWPPPRRPAGARCRRAHRRSRSARRRGRVAARAATVDHVAARQQPRGHAQRRSRSRRRVDGSTERQRRRRQQHGQRPVARGLEGDEAAGLPPSTSRPSSTISRTRKPLALAKRLEPLEQRRVRDRRRRLRELEAFGLGDDGKRGGQRILSDGRVAHDGRSEAESRDVAASARRQGARSASSSYSLACQRCRCAASRWRRAWRRSARHGPPTAPPNSSARWSRQRRCAVSMPATSPLAREPRRVI